MKKTSLSHLLQKLPYPATEKWKHGVWFEQVFAKNDFSLELYSPKIEDLQSPHEQDEIYIIAQGNGEFVLENELFECKENDVFFVPKGKPHYFKNFSQNFATWVIFFGEKA